MAAAETIVVAAVMAVLRHEGEDDEECEVGILITDDDTIRELNRTYRDVDAPTDVLAFAMREGVDGALHPEMLGDLVLSVPTATRQAKEEGHSLAHELAFLSIHGTLHLLGYDHDVDDREDVMRAREREIMDALKRSEEWPDWESRLIASMRD